MKYLLDTHILIWALTDVGRLSEQAKELLSSEGEFYFSPISIWEIAIKHAKHPVQMAITAADARQLALDAGLMELKVDSRHGVAIAKLPDFHADPFDRMLITQARVDGLRLLTHDDTVVLYGESIVKV